MKEKLNTIRPKLIFFFIFIISWWAVWYLKFWPNWLFPSPVAVAEKLFEGFNNYTFILGILTSMKRILIGFSISVIIGTMLGFLIARVNMLHEALGSLILGLQTLPSICWLPLALLWFGLNETAITFVVVMGTVLSITISVQTAINNIPPSLVKVGRMLGASRLSLHRHVTLPAILPYYVMGLKQGWSFAWRSLISGEMLFITTGLGQLLALGRELNDMAQVMAVMIVIIFIGVTFDQLIFGLLERKISHRWGLTLSRKTV